MIGEERDKIGGFCTRQWVEEGGRRENLIVSCSRGMVGGGWGVEAGLGRGGPARIVAEWMERMRAES